MSVPIHCESLHAKSPCLLKLLNAIGNPKACKALIGNLFLSLFCYHPNLAGPKQMLKYAHLVVQSNQIHV